MSEQWVGVVGGTVVVVVAPTVVVDDKDELISSNVIRYLNFMDLGFVR